MKILLAGPLPHDNKNGGVAIFTKNLAQELNNKGYSVKVISSFNGFINHQIEIFSYYHTFHLLNQFKPEIIISSLGFSGLFLFTTSKAIKIHLLHGFTNFKNYNSVKVYVMHIFDSLVRKKFNYVLSNSEFTKFINDEIFNIKSDGLFRIGLNNLCINRAMKAPHIHKRKSVLYVGRMVDAKNIKLIYEAFNRINDKSASLNFIGYGSESSWIIDKSKNKSNVSFLGFKPNKDTFRYYRKAKVFISLNPSEPYGITFLEALLNGDFIIAPNTGGQVDFLKQFPKRCRLVNVNNIGEIVSAIKYGLNINLVPFFDVYKNISKFTYDETWNDISHVIDSRDAL